MIPDEPSCQLPVCEFQPRAGACAHVVFAGGVLRRETQLLSGLLEESLGSSLKTGDQYG